MRVGHLRPWRRACIVAVVAAASVLGLTGCSKVINAIKTVHNVLHQGAAISSLSNKLKTADTKAYEVTYVTTGANPVTTEYAASPPHDFAFGTTLSGKVLDVISNPTGEFACSKSPGRDEHLVLLEAPVGRGRDLQGHVRPLLRCLLDRLPEALFGGRGIAGHKDPLDDHVGERLRPLMCRDHG